MPRPKKTSAIEPSPAPRPPIAVIPAIIIGAIVLAAFVLLAIGDLTSNSPTSDETTHLVSGYLYLTQNDYRLNPEHPPLLKKLAALPLLGMQIWPRGFTEAGDGSQAFAMLREAWSMGLSNPGMAQWRVAQHVLYGLRDSALRRVGGDANIPPTTARYERNDFLNDAEAMFRRGRFMMLLVGIALAVVIFLWSYEVWGRAGALASLLLFCFDPNFIAHSALVTTDVGASLFIATTMYLLWRLKTHFTPARLAFFAFVFGLALCAKYSAAFLAPLVVFIAIGEAAFARFDKRESLRMLAAAAAAAVVGFVLIWAMYGFRFSAAANPAQAAAEDEAARRTLVQKVVGAPDVWPTGHLPLRQMVDRFEGTRVLLQTKQEDYSWNQLRAATRTAPHTFLGRALLFADAKHLLPEAYVYGFASTAATSLIRSGYLDGEVSVTGFRSYFFWTFLYKTPLLAILAVCAGLFLALRDRTRRGALLYVLGPALVYAAIAVGSNINIGYRHFFPVLPFIYVACGSLGIAWEKLQPKARVASAAVFAAILAITSSVVLMPKLPTLFGDHLSYLNEIAGGPIRGVDRLSDSNFDWGQDLGRLAAWTDRSHIAEPISLYYFGNADPRHYGIRYYDLRTPELPEPRRPGYFALSQIDYLGATAAPDMRDRWRTYLERVHAKRIGTAGYSIFIYRIE